MSTTCITLDEIFAHENYAYLVSLSEYGKLCKTDKSKFLNYLQEIQEPSYDAPQDMEMIVIDGAALVRMNPPKYSKTFSEYCESKLVGEKTAWNVWEAFPEITDVFARLLLGSADIADDDLTLIERFVVLLYDRTGSTASVNGARRWLFTKKGTSIGNCPPTLNSLLQHIYRSILQSSSCRQARNVLKLLAVRSKFGWDGASPIWMTIAEAAKSCQELVKCGCKKNWVLQIQKNRIQMY